MFPTRRGFAAASLGTLFAQSPAKVQFGVTDWNIGLGAKLEAVEFAATAGFAGVEVSLGLTPVNGKLALDNPQLLDDYLRLTAQKRIAVAGTCIDILNRECLKKGGQALQWVRDGVRITRRLGARVMLVPFFGRDCSAETEPELRAVAAFLKELAPAAADAGVTLGLENWLSAEDNARLLDEVGSKWVRVYYDVGNSTRRGRDPAKEIRWLGAERICQVHLKENPITLHFGEGKMDFVAIVRALTDIGFSGWANLEMTFPPESRSQDLHRNLVFMRNLFASAKRPGA